MTKRSISTELSGGGGFDYEHRVAALYLTALLRSEGASGVDGTVTRVALQQEAAGEPMDDIVVDTELSGITGRFGVQAKTSLTISSAAKNNDFRKIITNAEKTRNKDSFKVGRDSYGFAAFQISDTKIRSLKRLIDWAKDSPTTDDYSKRFEDGGQASKDDKGVRNSILTLLEKNDIAYEQTFLRHFVALKLDVIDDQSPLATYAKNNLSTMLVQGVPQAPVLWSDLCSHAKKGAITGAVWTRATLLDSLRTRFNLVAAPIYARDLKKLAEYATADLRQINDDIGGHKIKRSRYLREIATANEKHRFINITGLPGCGKSVVLKTVAIEAAKLGPILFLKSDRLHGNSWVSHATTLGIQQTEIGNLLTEVGAAGTATLFVDGVDRIEVGQRQVVLDVIDAILFNEANSHWHIIVTSRDQGLEAFRSWLGPALMTGRGIKDISVGPLSDGEAEELAAKVPRIHGLLFGNDKVREIARRPFFTSILANHVNSTELNSSTYPSTESELLSLIHI